jgi:hypothetical protein
MEPSAGHNKETALSKIRWTLGILGLMLGTNWVAINESPLIVF